MITKGLVYATHRAERWQALASESGARLPLKISSLIDHESLELKWNDSTREVLKLHPKQSEHFVKLDLTWRRFCRLKVCHAVNYYWRRVLHCIPWGNENSWWDGESNIDLNQHEIRISPDGGVMGSGLIARRSIAWDNFFSEPTVNRKSGSSRQLDWLYLSEKMLMKVKWTD